MPPSWPHFPGAGHVSYRQVVPGDGERPGPALFRVLRDAVEAAGSRSATTAPSPSCRPTAARSSWPPAASNTTRRCATPTCRCPLTAVGHPGNTGDAIRLAQQAGASLWHMSAFFGWFAFRHPDHVAAFPLDVHAPSFIYVDGDGRRFADETGWEVHDRLRCLTTYLPRRRNRPRMPGYLVFDERARLAGPLNGIVGTPNDYAWSADNSAELEAGWIRPVEEIDAPAAAKHAQPSTARSPTSSAATRARSSRSNRRCTRSRWSPRWRRPPAGRDATRRRAPCDQTGRRYPASSPLSGSIWGHLTEHGGGLTDAIVFGRIAGEGAAAAA